MTMPNEQIDVRQIQTEIMPLISVEKSEKLIALENEVLPLLRQAEAIQVRTPDQRTSAIEYLKQNKAAQVRVVELFKAPKTFSDKVHSFICSMENQLLKNGLQFKETVVRAKIAQFTAEEERKAEELRAKLQAEADEKTRRDREKQEAAARKQRQIEDEARARADAARWAAENANAEERARLQHEAEVAERKANAAAAKAEVREEAAVNIIAPVIEVSSIIKKVEGESSRKVWSAECTNLLELIRAANGNMTAYSFLMFDERAANDFARHTQGAIPIPGVEFKSRSSLG